MAELLKREPRLTVKYLRMRKVGNVFYFPENPKVGEVEKSQVLSRVRLREVGHEWHLLSPSTEELKRLFNLRKEVSFMRLPSVSNTGFWPIYLKF